MMNIIRLRRIRNQIQKPRHKIFRSTLTRVGQHTKVCGKVASVTAMVSIYGPMEFSTTVDGVITVLTGMENSFVLMGIPTRVILQMI